MPIDDFLDFLQDRIGDGLRVVTWYTDETFGGIYIRPDLNRNAVNDRVEFLSKRLMTGRGPVSDSPMNILGKEKAMVQVRENAVILRFPLQDNRGIIVSLDIELASDLHGFVMECTEHLDGETINFRTSTLSAGITPY